MAILSTLESTTLDETSRPASKQVILILKKQNPELINLECVTYTQPNPPSSMASWVVWKLFFYVTLDALNKFSFQNKIK